MLELIPPWPLFSAFLIASLVLALTPGPGVLYIVARSLVQGRRSGLVSVAGVALGNPGNAFAVAIALAALFAVSPAAFTVIKYAGALYLVYLGVQMLRAARSEIPAAPVAQPAPLARIFRDGFVVALLNPKTKVFFAAFLPQFLGPETSPMGQTLMLGTLFVAIATVTDSAYALAAGAVAPALTRAPQGSPPWPPCGWRHLHRPRHFYGADGNSRYALKAEPRQRGVSHQPREHCMYESKNQQPLASAGFARRLLGHLLVAVGLLGVSLALGMIGYVLFENLSWLDAFLNAAMLLGGMGPVNPPQTGAGKLFAGFYALYAGLVFIVTAALLFTPILHRLIHRFHWDEKI